jgi:hypothetical protein
MFMIFHKNILIIFNHYKLEQHVNHLQEIIKELLEIIQNVEKINLKILLIQTT